MKEPKVVDTVVKVLCIFIPLFVFYNYKVKSDEDKIYEYTRQIVFVECAVHKPEYCKKDISKLRSDDVLIAFKLLKERK